MREVESTLQMGSGPLRWRMNIAIQIPSLGTRWLEFKDRELGDLEIHAGGAGCPGGGCFSQHSPSHQTKPTCPPPHPQISLALGGWALGKLGRGEFPCPHPLSRKIILKPLRISPMGAPVSWPSCLSDRVCSAGQEVGLGIRL